MPMFFRTIMRQDTPSVETDLVSFRSKLQEVVKGFFECWPMFDLIFDVGEKPVEDDKNFDGGGGGGGGGDKPGGGDGGGKAGGVGGGGGSGDQGKAPADGDKDKGKAGGGGSGGGMAGAVGRRPADGGKQRRAQEVAQMLATLKDQIDSMQLMPARDKHVDILILTENSDIEWVMEESFSEYSLGLGASSTSLGGGPAGADRTRRTSIAPVPLSAIAMATFIPGTAVPAADGGEGAVAKDDVETTPLIGKDAQESPATGTPSGSPASASAPLPSLPLPPPPPKGIASLALRTIDLLIPRDKDPAAPVVIEINPSPVHQQQQQQQQHSVNRTGTQTALQQ